MSNKAYGKEGNFDIEQIDGYQFMDEEEKAFFENYGDTICDQADLIADQHGIDSETMREEFSELSDSFLYNENEYIVEQAILTCSMKTEKTQLLKYEGAEVESKPIATKSMSRITITEDRTETIGGLIPVNVTDTSGGLRDAGKKLNIVSFGNCQYIKDGTLIEDMAKKLCKAIGKESETVEKIKEKIKVAIEEGKGTCYCCMNLNPEWENMPSGYNFATGIFEDGVPNAGISEILMNSSYFQFNGNEGINMMSMLFCKCGGIISATMSGQIETDGINIWNDYELKLLDKYYDQLAYKNWSLEKKLGAEELWKTLYEEKDTDPMFVIGMIGNLYGEGAAGMLEGKWNWKSRGLNIEKYGSISNIQEARIACASPDKWGVGMIQWSNPVRKEGLLKNHEYFAMDDGTLTMERLMAAECKTISDELWPNEQDKNAFTGCKDIYPEYLQFIKGSNGIGSEVEFATCLLLKKYEISGESGDVDFKSLMVKDGIWEEALNAQSFSQVPSICKRIIAAKIAYEELKG